MVGTAAPAPAQEAATRASGLQEPVTMAAARVGAARSKARQPVAVLCPAATILRRAVVGGRNRASRHTAAAVG